MKEIKLALQDAGRQMYRFISHKRRNAQRQMRRQIFERYIPEVAKALNELAAADKAKIIKGLESLLQKNNKELEVSLEKGEAPKEKEETENGEDEGKA
jgi:DNA topoisomerase VI subunit B